jgi:predicted nuclease of restriction endonuclease-like (RecB) superfamily
MWELACSGRRSDEEALPSTIDLILPERSRFFVRPFLKVIADTLCLIRRNRFTFSFVLQEFGMTAPSVPGSTTEDRFNEVLALIQSAKQQAIQAVNTQLIELYWQVGAYISRKLEKAEWGDSVVSQLAEHLAQTQPGLRGFTRSNLFRMRQFYEAYHAEEKVAPLVRQLSWSHNLIIFSQSKRPEEREFYVRLAVQEKWSKRELERQFKAALFERSVTQPAKATAVLRQTHPEALNVFRDAYMLEFLDLPSSHGETDLHKGLLARLKEFLIELGRDFCFVGSERPLQVGGRDFALDLLFFHRGLNCLVAIELKVGRFEPEYLGKLNFYLEALDRNERKPHENPAIGVLLCASKDDEVVEYALNRSLSPALIAEYQVQLPDKQLLQAKLHEFYALNLAQGEEY